MYKVPKEPLRETAVQSTWERLVRKERAMRRNLWMCRLIHPIGTLLCAWNLLLVSINLWIFMAGDKIGSFFEKLPYLPSRIASMPRNNWSEVLSYSLKRTYIQPLLICGLIACIFYLVTLIIQIRKKIPLNGTTMQCASALTVKAENVYELRRKMPRWTVSLEAGIMTLITAYPIALMFIDYASKGVNALQLVLILMALLLWLLISFWFYVLVLYVFTLINSLFYFSRGKWAYYELYHWVNNYYEMTEYLEDTKIDPYLAEQGDMAEETVMVDESAFLPESEEEITQDEPPEQPLELVE